jgi:hypothetical protein
MAQNGKLWQTGPIWLWLIKTANSLSLLKRFTFLPARNSIEPRSQNVSSPNVKVDDLLDLILSDHACHAMARSGNVALARIALGLLAMGSVSSPPAMARRSLG